MNIISDKNANDSRICENPLLQGAIATLNIHMQNKKYFKPYAFAIHKGEFVRENFASKNNRQSYYLECELNECNFKEAGFAGSVFVKCKFINCNFNYSNFRACDFRECEITSNKEENHEILSANFSESIFSKCLLSDLFLNSTNFCDVIFDNGHIKNSKWRSMVLENMIIKNSTIDNLRFSSQNFDFFTLENIRTINVVFPFPAMPCIINGLDYLYHTNDNVMFTSVTSSQKRISKDKYLSLINDFEIYYENTDSYYQLVNIKIAQNHIDKAIYNAGLGIIQSIRLRNFRLVYQYCKILQIQPSFIMKYRKELYQLIQNEVNKENLSTEEYLFFNIYNAKIKELLLNSTTMPHLILDIRTNIDSKETNKLSIMIEQVESLLEYYIAGEEEHFIEIRHNSPINIIVQISADPEKLVMFLASFFTCIHYSSKAISFIIKKAKQLSAIKYKKENNILDDKMNQSISQTFINSNISVTNVNYNIYNAYDLDTTIQSGCENNKNTYTHTIC